MIYSINYDKKEVVLNISAVTNWDKCPKNWEDKDLVKELNTNEYPISSDYKIIK